jgi:hypothetical protein
MASNWVGLAAPAVCKLESKRHSKPKFRRAIIRSLDPARIEARNRPCGKRRSRRHQTFDSSKASKNLLPSCRLVWVLRYGEQAF